MVVVEFVELPVLEADKQVVTIDPNGLDLAKFLPSLKARTHVRDRVFRQRFAALWLVLGDHRGQNIVRSLGRATAFPRYGLVLAVG